MPSTCDRFSLPGVRFTLVRLYAPAYGPAGDPGVARLRHIASIGGMVDYLIVSLLGGVVGLGELVSRYRNYTGFVLLNYITYIYVGINVAASIGALTLIHAFDWTFGVDSGPEAVRTTQVLVASFGAMALLRSALFVVRIGDQDVQVGPAAFLTGLAETADNALARRIDMRNIATRAKFARLARDLSWDRARMTLPVYVMALMQNVTPEEQQAVAEQVNRLDVSSLDEQGKVASLGLLLINVVGPEVFAIAIDLAQEDLERRPDVAHDVPQEPEPTAEPSESIG